MGLELQCVWMKRLMSISRIRIFMPKGIQQLNHENLLLCQIQLNLAYHSPNHFSCFPETPFCPRWGQEREPQQCQITTGSLRMHVHAHTHARAHTPPHPIKLSLLMRWLINKDRMEKVVRLKFPRKMSRVVQFFQENGSLIHTVYSYDSNIASHRGRVGLGTQMHYFRRKQNHQDSLFESFLCDRGILHSKLSPRIQTSFPKIIP